VNLWDVRLNGGPRHGTNVCLAQLPRTLAVPGLGVDLPELVRFNPKRPPVTVHVYDLYSELISPGGGQYAEYEYQVTREPDGTERQWVAALAVDGPPQYEFWYDH
jgi:hypothetical protein